MVPVRIRPAASRRPCSVRKLRVPSSSPSPHRPALSTRAARRLNSAALSIAHRLPQSLGINCGQAIPARIGRMVDLLAVGVGVEPGDRFPDAIGELLLRREAGHDAPELCIVENRTVCLIAPQIAFFGRVGGYYSGC